LAADDSGEKSEEPTLQRREDFRKRGQVAQSKELATVFSLFATVLGMWILGRFFLEQLVEVFNKSLGTFLIDSVRTGSWSDAFMFASKKILLLVSPIFGMLWLAAFLSSTIQIGFLVNEEALQFKIEKLSPLSGFKRIFSMKSAVEGVKAVLKVSAVCGVVFLILKSEIFILPNLVYLSVDEIIVYVGEISIKLLGGVGFLMLLLALVDYSFQKFDLEKQMKMTKQEVKEEHKSREGDPLIKARIRRTQREMASRRMMDDVPKADVIITNPTHIAVALKYDAVSVAPMIVAMGAGIIAEKIKELAKEHNIPVMENKPLARTIFKTLKIGQSIPRELYAAVAEVLSYVYRLKRKKFS